MRTIILTLTASLMAGAALAQGAPPANETVVLQNARLYTMAGANGGLIENADVVMSGGVVTAVGQDLAVPAGARAVDARGRIVTPGLIAPWSQIGLVEIGLDEESNDSSTDGEFAFSASLDAGDGFNPASTLIAINRAGGVTRALTAPEPGFGGGGHAHDAGDTKHATASSPAAPGGRMFGGHAAIVSLSGAPESVVKPRAAQSVVMGSGGAALASGSRVASWAALRDILDAAADYAGNPGDFARRTTSDRYSVRDLAALLPVLRGEQPLVVAVNRASEIRTLIKLKAERRLNVVILGGTEAHLLARELAAAGIPVILNSFLNLPSQFEDLAATQTNAARLNAAGVVIGFYNPPSGTHNLRLLPQLAGNAVANGLPYAAALAALTINPARMYGVSDRYGSVEIGKAADLVVWDGDPLETSSRPVAVYIDGRATSLVTRQTRLRDRYRDLSRGDLPHAYRGAQ
jgi:imidazolonepropionase-like amidohydrolase